MIKINYQDDIIIELSNQFDISKNTTDLSLDDIKNIITIISTLK